VVGLVASLVLTTKASDDPTYDGQAAVHGHPKVAAGSGRQKPISETPLMSSEADSEEHTMPLVMTEDNAMMLSEEVQLTNAHESNEAMIKEMSEHDKVISVHEFKEVLHKLVKDAVDKIAMKKAGIVGKLKTAKQILIGQDGEATGRDPQQSSSDGDLSFLENSDLFSLKDYCRCDGSAFNSRGQGDCNLRSRDFNGREWCYLSRHFIADVGESLDCSDAKPSSELDGFLWSHAACDTKPLDLPWFFSPQEIREAIEELIKKDLNSNCIRTCFLIDDGDSVCLCSK